MISLSDYDYDLPKEYIAQRPAEKRDESKLMIVNRSLRTLSSTIFRDIENFLNPGDLLVFNDTKVIPARLLGHRKMTKGKVELFLLKEIEPDRWEALVKPARRIKMGEILSFGSGLDAIVVEELREGIRIVEFNQEPDQLKKILAYEGQVPLPPYIEYKPQMAAFYKDRYQTVFSKNEGSVAAPTAGLHFTPELVSRMEKKGVQFSNITLSVGIGTFRPIEASDVTKHKMHSETYELPQETVSRIIETKAKGNRVVTIGTTSTRVLEGVFKKHGKLVAGSGDVDLFIYPGYSFNVIDGIVTNFHLPKSSLLLMISAFASKELVFEAYEQAKSEKFRFFSFGDSMLIV